MASRQNLLQFAVCVITSKITKLIIMFYCVIVRFKQSKFISSKINDNVKQIDVSRLVSMQMADSRLETSLHPVHNLALRPSACVAVIRLRTNERQTRVLLQKQLARWATHASLSIPRFNQFWAWSLC